jgi:glutathione S-transferase
MTAIKTRTLKLRYSSASPFVRKVLVFAHEIGVAGRIELVPADVWDPGSDIAHDNPLGKVPAMITDHGPLAGSTLCCEYLDALHTGTRLFSHDPQNRFPALQRHALADGIIEAAVAHVVETLRRPTQFVYDGMLARQQDKINRTLDVLEREVASFDTIDLASVTLGCALGYLDFRLGTINWRQGRPHLANWYAQFETRPSMLATRPSTGAPSPAPATGGPA